MMTDELGDRTLFINDAGTVAPLRKDQEAIFRAAGYRKLRPDEHPPIQQYELDAVGAKTMDDVLRVDPLSPEALRQVRQRAAVAEAGAGDDAGD